MIVIDATDKLEGIASVADVIEFTCSVVDGSTTGSSEGKLGTGQTQIWDATEVTRILSLTLVNTHSAAVTVNVQKDPGDAGTLYRVIGKDLSLGIGYMLTFDGQRCTVLDASGRPLEGYGAHASDHTDGTDDIQSATNIQKGIATAAHITSIEANTSASHTQNTDTNLGTLGTTTLIDTDKVISRDSADADVIKTSTWAQVKAFLKTYFDTIYSALAHKTRHQNGGSDEIDVGGLSGVLADDQHVIDAEVLAAAGVNSGITSMTGLDDNGIPLEKVEGASTIRQNLLTNTDWIAFSNSNGPHNVGDQVTLSDVTNGVCSSADTKDLVIGKLFKFDAGDFSSELYEITAITVDTSFTLNNTSLTDSGAPGTGYEITAGNTAADNLGPDGWYKDTTLDVYREHNGSNTKDGSFYSMKCSPSNTNDFLFYPANISSNEKWLAKFAGRPVTIGAWVKTSTASHVRLVIHDGGVSYSDYHTGSGDFEWIEFSDIMSSSLTSAIFGFSYAQSSGDIYLSQPMLVFGDRIGTGNYSRNPGEIIYLEEQVQSTEYYGTALSDQAVAELNVVADTELKIGKGANAYDMQTLVTDTASSTNVNVFIKVGPDSSQIDLGNQIGISYGALPNGDYQRKSSMVRTNADGNVDVTIGASGSETLTPYILYKSIHLK